MEKVIGLAYKKSGKAICALISIVLLVTAFSVCWQTIAQTSYLGDLNDDGIVDAADAILVLRYDAGLTTLTAKQLAAGDLNGDGLVDAADAIKIRRIDAGFEAPVEISTKASTTESTTVPTTESTTVPTTESTTKQTTAPVTETTTKNGMKIETTNNGGHDAIINW